MLLLAFLLAGPLVVYLSGDLDLETHWSEASMRSMGQAPDPALHPEALVQVYGARAYNWRGAFGIHTWIAVKKRDASQYTIYQVIGWNLRGGNSSVSIRQRVAPDFRWYNAEPFLLVEHSGEAARELVRDIEQAVADYPYAGTYSVWPGPNSNSFVAWIARRVPELRLDLPPTAIGKDWIDEGVIVGPMPSGTGWQVSLGGLLGAGVALEEGVEFNLLGLGFGVDFNDPALRWPGLGKWPPQEP
ncbi:MAG: DUF3750 domain-containing protein [Gammaproteobacteria bacterium]